MTEVIDFVMQIFYPAKIKQLEEELAANKKALSYATSHFSDCLGHKVTNQDLKEFLANVQRIEGGVECRK